MQYHIISLILNIATIISFNDMQYLYRMVLLLTIVYCAKNKIFSYCLIMVENLYFFYNIYKNYTKK